MCDHPRLHGKGFPQFFGKETGGLLLRQKKILAKYILAGRTKTLNTQDFGAGTTKIPRKTNTKEGLGEDRHGRKGASAYGSYKHAKVYKVTKRLHRTTEKTTNSKKNGFFHGRIFKCLHSLEAVVFQRSHKTCLMYRKSPTFRAPRGLLSMWMA